VTDGVGRSAVWGILVAEEPSRALAALGVAWALVDKWRARQVRCPQSAVSCAL